MCLGLWSVHDVFFLDRMQESLVLGEEGWSHITECHSYVIQNCTLNDLTCFVNDI